MSTSTLIPHLDGKRLARQLADVRAAMVLAGESNTWLTLRELSKLTHYGEASISARLREMRTIGFDVRRRRRGTESKGIWEYRATKREMVQEKLF
jgi:hypothetical protein